MTEQTLMTIRLDRDLFVEFKALTVKEGTTMSLVVREALEEWIKVRNGI
jgi:predicted DNA-binding protein